MNVLILLQPRKLPEHPPRAKRFPENILNRSISGNIGSKVHVGDIEDGLMAHSSAPYFTMAEQRNGN